MIVEEVFSALQTESETEFQISWINRWGDLVGICFYSEDPDAKVFILDKGWGRREYIASACRPVAKVLHGSNRYGEQYQRRRILPARVWISGVKLGARALRAMLEQGGCKVPADDSRFRLKKGRNGVWTVTDGCFVLPVKYPGRRNHKIFKEFPFLSRYGKQEWGYLLRAIIGKHLREVLEDESVLKEKVKEQKQLHRLHRLVRQRRAGQCFLPPSSKVCSWVALGESIVWQLRLSDDEEIYILDSPEYARAAYLFCSYRDAKHWAARRVSHQQARASALWWTPHSEGWEERIRKVLSDLSEVTGKSSP